LHTRPNLAVVDSVSSRRVDLETAGIRGFGVLEIFLPLPGSLGFSKSSLLRRLCGFFLLR
jgi:hypothetical protein